jgi:hypothetical protein
MSPIGVTVTNTEAQTPSGPPTTTGVAFFVGLADEGPTTPVGVNSIAAAAAVIGPRSSTNSVLYDALDAFFHEGGTYAYIVRVDDNTAVAAALTLNDATPHPTVVVTADTPGIDGDNVYVAVIRGSGTTFTGTTTSTSPTVSAVSSFANIGVGTPVSGTGIPAGTYVSAVNPGASTLTLSANATASGTGVTITPATFTVEIEDSAGDILESHGPYITTAQLIADTSSEYVTFSQSSGSGNTTNVPVASSAAALTGGANPNDISASSYAAALNNIPASLGPGQVAVPGQSNATVWAALAAHAYTNNRYALIDLADNSSASAVVAALAGNIGQHTGHVLPVAGSPIIPGVTPGTTRTVAASAVAAALCARVAATGNDNQMPCGINWPLNYVTGFTETYNTADTNTLEAAGINTWANRYGTLCLFGFVSAAATDKVFWQANCGRERMALTADALEDAEGYLFDPIDGQGLTVAALAGKLQGTIAAHWAAKALFGANATDAGSVDTSGNTPTTAAAGQLLATLTVNLTESALQVPITIVYEPLAA